ncbi:MAG: hypothetical protein ACK56W_10870 [Pirellula sp.]|jgi:hypothetical protein|nr:ankyrin repeat domain-containing protein [Pirellula sp.]
MGIVWDGITDKSMLNDWVIEARNELSDAAKNYEWQRVFRVLDKHPEFVNTARIGGKSLYTPLHQAAHGGATVDIARSLIEKGAWRTIQNVRGERPVDVAARCRHQHLTEVLAPDLKRHVPFGVLHKIQAFFHSVINRRIHEMELDPNLRFPELESLLELERSKIWFAIPGMYGGFSYWLEHEGVEAKLICESWCRVAGGSGQRHEITSIGSQLVAEGFV